MKSIIISLIIVLICSSFSFADSRRQRYNTYEDINFALNTVMQVQSIVGTHHWNQQIARQQPVFIQQQPVFVQQHQISEVFLPPQVIIHQQPVFVQQPVFAPAPPAYFHWRAPRDTHPRHRHLGHRHHHGRSEVFRGGCGNHRGCW